MPQIEIHGTPDYAELEALGLTPADVVFFSSNINPYGPPQAVVDAIHAAVTAKQIALYPDRFSIRLRHILAAYHTVSPDAILVGNGTADLMWLLATGFTSSQHVVVLGPTFGEYENVASMMAARCTVVAHPGWLRQERNFVQSDRTLDEAAEEIAAAHPDWVFVCNPNNPTGRHLTPSELQILHAAASAAAWIVDEAYAEFAPEPWSAVDWIESGRWIVLRSMTKDFTLGGLRLGYLVASPAQVAALQQSQPPWNVNVFAQIAGEAAMSCQSWHKETTARLREHVASMQGALRSHGFAPHPSATIFFLLPVHDSAATVRASLLEQGLVVRDCTSFGLPHHVRIAIQKPEENGRLVAALAAM